MLQVLEVFAFLFNPWNTIWESRWEGTPLQTKKNRPEGEGAGCCSGEMKFLPAFPAGFLCCKGGTWSRMVTVSVLLVYWVSCLMPTRPKCRITNFSVKAIWDPSCAKLGGVCFRSLSVKVECWYSHTSLEYCRNKFVSWHEIKVQKRKFYHFKFRRINKGWGQTLQTKLNIE